MISIRPCSPLELLTKLIKIKSFFINLLKTSVKMSRLNPMSMFSTLLKVDNVSLEWLSMLIQDWLILNLIVFPINIIYIRI